MAIRTLPSQEYLCQCFIYNPESGELRWRERPLSHFKNSRIHNNWNSKMAGFVIKHKNTSGHIQVSINYSLFLVHRIIWKLITGQDPEFLIDHRDRIKTNNIWDNLRSATKTQNTANRKVDKRSIIGLKGVYQSKGNSNFKARISVNGKTTHIGSFKTAQEAHEAYCVATQKLYGDFWSPG